MRATRTRALHRTAFGGMTAAALACGGATPGATAANSGTTPARDDRRPAGTQRWRDELPQLLPAVGQEMVFKDYGLLPMVGSVVKGQCAPVVAYTVELFVDVSNLANYGVRNLVPMATQQVTCGS